MARPAHIREMIVNLLKEDHVLSAVAIGEKLARLGSTANKTTIYRSLQKLLEDGVVCKQTLGGDDFVYELRDHHHDHLVCTECGQMQSIACKTDISKIIEGFTIDHHHTTFFGLCTKCQDQSSN